MLRIFHCILHKLIALSFSIWLWKIYLRFAIRDTDNSGERVHTTLQLSFVATGQRIRIHSINFGAVTRDTISGIIAVAIVGISNLVYWNFRKKILPSINAVQEGIQKPSFIGFAGGVGQIVYLIYCHCLRIDKRVGKIEVNV